MRSFFLLLTVTIFLQNIFAQSGKVGDKYKFHTYGYEIMMDNKGILADININGEKGGYFDHYNILFSGGFLISGFTADTLWGNGQASAMLVINYEPGIVGDSFSEDAVIYVINDSDTPFGQSWRDWADAVKLGADFYDGDNNGVYDPNDLNSNGVWDPDEDKPLFPGTYAAFCVFNDSQPVEERTYYPGMAPQGIEIRQYVYDYWNSSDPYTTMYVEYRIINKNPDMNDFKDVIFGIWADPDLEDFSNDYSGCETDYSAGFTYCKDFGVNLSLFISSWTPGDMETYFSSFIHFQQSPSNINHPTNPSELRNIQMGLDRNGNIIDPCNWTLGNLPDDCASIDNKRWYSGDPVTGEGWLNTTEGDQQIMLNVGPFDLNYGEEKRILVTYATGVDINMSGSFAMALNSLENLYGSIQDNDEEETAKQLNFVLHQNYPNPFNPSTKISYHIVNESFVKLSVFDVLGKEVAILKKGLHDAGDYTVEFNAENLAGGVYYYRLQAGEQFITKKSLLLK